MSFHITIRQATLTDIPLIRAIAEVSFRHTYRDILSSEQMDYMMEWMYGVKSLHDQIVQESHTYFIATTQDVAVGYVSVQTQGCSDDGLPLWHLQKIYILPDYQGSGIGKELFSYALFFIQSQSGTPTHVELNVNRANRAVTFYEHMGMQRLRQGDFPIGHGYFMNDYIMGIDI